MFWKNALRMVVVTLMFATVILAVITLFDSIRSPIPGSAEKWVISAGIMQVEAILMFTLLSCYIVSNLVNLYQRKQYTHSWAIIFILLGFNIQGAISAFNPGNLWNTYSGTATDTDFRYMTFLNIMNALVIGLDLVKVYTSSPEPDELVKEESNVVKSLSPRWSPNKRRR
jgi:hypothetical protein